MSISLVLFDIDGTLMITKGAGSRSLLSAGRSVFGDRFEWTDVTVGTLDTQIFEQLVKHNSINDAVAYRDMFRDVYVRKLAREIQDNAQDVTVLPGMGNLVRILNERARSAGDVILGLLTGNFAEAARIKLVAAGFDLSMFRIQVYAEDGTDRSQLPLVALERASSLVGETVLPQNTLIIGDTPRDIECALACGCNVLAVATGHFSVQQLKEARANHVVTTLDDPSPVVEWLDGIRSGRSVS